MNENNINSDTNNVENIEIDETEIRNFINEQVTTSAIEILFSELDPAVSSTLYPQLKAGDENNKIRLSNEGIVFSNNNEMTLGGKLSIGRNDNRWKRIIIWS